MKKIFTGLAIVVILVIVGLFVPVKSVETGGSCGDQLFTERYNLILGDSLPQAGGSTIEGEGCAPLIKHVLYIL